jgi:hypothetical protein
MHGSRLVGILIDTPTTQARANDKLAQIDKHTNGTGTVNLRMPTLARDS